MAYFGGQRTKEYHEQHRSLISRVVCAYVDKFVQSRRWECRQLASVSDDLERIVEQPLL
eukprot:SAG11_NODE_231_length_11932_cov_40.992817_1_plen_59_part_00